MSKSKFYDNIPPITGNPLILNNIEREDQVLFGEKPLNKMQGRSNNAEKPVIKQKRAKKAQNAIIEGVKKSVKERNSNEIVTHKRLNQQQRVTFTPNKYIKTLIKEIEAKYGSTGKSEFINSAIEAEYNRRK